jgi:hypothetical protein
MFQLTPEEMENWKSQIVTSNREKMGLRNLTLGVELATEQLGEVCNFVGLSCGLLTAKTNTAFKKYG